MGEQVGPQCAECGASTVAAFVQHGSYFTRCMACHAEGPATSWLALRRHLQGRFKAVSVAEDFEPLAIVAQGEVDQIAEAISKAAQEGKLVRLLAETTGT